MTDEKDKPEVEAAESGAEGPLGGERLAEARRAKQISVLEIAKELHVEEAKIRALENNEFEFLGAPVFAKGHLKKYSQLVGVDHDDVMADYYRLTRSQEMPPVINLQRQKPRRELSPGPLIAAIILLVLLALAYWMLIERPFTTPPVPASVPSATPDTGAPLESEPVEPEIETAPATEATAPDGGEAAGEEPAAEPLVEEAQEQLPADVPQESPAVVQQQPPAVAENTAGAAAGEDEVRLSVTFLGDCWTEITDASGRRLFFQLGRSGRTVNVSGPGPLTVLFGDGEDFTIPAANRRGRTARLTISGT
jgi:cytoskeleton protein RodZ